MRRTVKVSAKYGEESRYFDIKARVGLIGGKQGSLSG